MPLREQLLEIRSTWPEYRSHEKVDKTHGTYTLVTDTVPETLRELLPEPEAYVVEGSTGRGLITAAPWIGSFHTEVTTSATSGYYLVYLYSEDLERLYLVFAIGATQFAEASSGKKQQYERMHQACARLRDVFARYTPPRLVDRLQIGNPRLAAANNAKLHRDYENGAIYFLEYALPALPDETQLVADYRDMMTFYAATVADPVTPSMESLLGGTVDLKTLPRDITATAFMPRPPRKSGSAGPGHTGGGRRSHGESKVVGDAGEQAVLEYERAKLQQAGLGHLSPEIVHEEAEGNRPGWDITSFDDAGEPIYIEVKATQGEHMDVFELTANEWLAAHDDQSRERYHVYLVTKALTRTPQIEIVKAPYRLLQEQTIEARPIRYAVSLSPSTDTDT